jgi:TonB family protein
MTQANPPVRPALLFVLQTRGTAAVGRSDVDVTLASGTIVRVRAGDVNDIRLTFLRTTLAQERSRLAEAARPRAAPPPDRTVGIEFDTKGADFGPWIRRFVAQVRRNLHEEVNSSTAATAAAATEQAQVVVAFTVRKDGSLMDVSVKEPSAVAAFNESTLRAVQKSSPTVPLPPDYPDQSAFFTVTVYFVLPPQVK